LFIFATNPNILQQSSTYIADLHFIASQALDNEAENDHFLRFVRGTDDKGLDELAHTVHDRVSAAIDCTSCANCCRSLVINVTQDEVGKLAGHLRLTESETRGQYIEESQQGNCFVNTIPCHFLRENKCTIYEARFTECRDFPHLHKPGFKDRLGGTLMHYGRCPIVYHVIEEMKVKLGFFED